MSRPRALGATEEPDAGGELDAWEPYPLQPRFEIEDVRLDGDDLESVAAAAGRIARCRLDGVRLAGSRLRSLRLIDVAVAESDLSNADWTGAQLNRVSFTRCRMTGFAGAGVQAEHVAFTGCKLDLANLRGARLRHVTFEDCVLDDADLGGTELAASRFTGCSLRRTLIDDARCKGVDLRGSRLEPDGDITALRGAVIDSVQLVELGPLLARGLGIDIRD